MPSAADLCCCSPHARTGRAQVSHSNMRVLKNNIICFFCFDDFAWPSGDQLPLNKVFNDPEYIA